MKSCNRNVVISGGNLDRFAGPVYSRDTETAEIFNQTKVLDRPLHCMDKSGVTLTSWLSFNTSVRAIKNSTIRSFDVLGAKLAMKPTHKVIKTSAGTDKELLASIKRMLNIAPS